MAEVGDIKFNLQIPRPQIVVIDGHLIPLDCIVCIKRDYALRITLLGPSTVVINRNDSEDMDEYRKGQEELKAIHDKLVDIWAPRKPAFINLTPEKNIPWTEKGAYTPNEKREQNDLK